MIDNYRILSFLLLLGLNKNDFRFTDWKFKFWLGLRLNFRVLAWLNSQRLNCRGCSMGTVTCCLLTGLDTNLTRQAIPAMIKKKLKTVFFPYFIPMGHIRTCRTRDGNLSSPACCLFHAFYSTVFLDCLLRVFWTARVKSAGRREQYAYMLLIKAKKGYQHFCKVKYKVVFFLFSVGGEMVFLRPW